jgi:hypothetical protein
MANFVPLLLFGFLIAVFQTPAQAQELGLEYSQGSQMRSEELTASGDFNKKEKKDKRIESIYNWDLSYTRTSQQTSSTALNGTSATINDNTNDFSFGLGLYRDTLSFGVTLDYSSTPEENLSSIGPEILLGYQFHFNSVDENLDEAKFNPYLKAEFGYGSENYTQTFETTKVARRKNAPVRPVTGINTIGQRYIAATLKLKTLVWLYVRAGYKKYSYSKDVSEFTQYLDNQQALGAPTSGFSSALSGFYDSTVFGQLHFDFIETWSFEMKRSVSKVALDKSQNTTDRILLSDDITPSWDLGVGTEIFHAGATGLSDTTILATADYTF